MSEEQATGDALGADEIAAVEKLNQAYRAIRSEAGKVIVGQHEVLEQLLIAMFAQGHCLLVGVPGLAKTLMIRTVANAFSLTFSRIQFTPDLMPADITGTEIITKNEASGDRTFKFHSGPIFANLILADEINRTPPKTQAALLEAMQEHQVTVAGTRHALPQPFFVLATQNPIEQEGTYPLPEAQLDRFMFNIKVDYPTEDEEFEIVRLTTTVNTPSITSVLDAAAVLDIQQIVRRVPVPDFCIRYAMRLVRATRKSKDSKQPEWIEKYIDWGAGPRASQYLILAAKCRAVLEGRHAVSPADIRAIALPVLRHRVITNFNAEADGVKPDDIVRRLIESIPVDESESVDRGTISAVLKPVHAGANSRS